MALESGWRAPATLSMAFLALKLTSYNKLIKLGDCGIWRILRRTKILKYFQSYEN